MAESFSQIPFHYQIANHDHENATFIHYNELVSNYERSKGPLTATQHAELIQIVEKRLAKGSQIQQDYLRAKAADTSPPNTWTWLKTMLRIGQVLAEARSMMNLIKSYGYPDVVYSFPPSAIPPEVGKKETCRASVKAPSPTPPVTSRSLTTTVRTTGSYIPIQHGLPVRASTEVPFVPNLLACRSCGSKSNMLTVCPILYYSDSNTDHQADWEDSTLGMAWAAVGFTE